MSKRFWKEVKHAIPGKKKHEKTKKGNKKTVGTIMKHKNIGSQFEDFLSEERIQEEVNVAAVKAVIARNLKEHMKKHAITQTDMAKKLRTSRSGLERLLDPENYSVTLLTLNRAARVLGKKVTINLINPERI